MTHALLVGIGARSVLAGFARTGSYLPIFHDDPSVNVYENEIRLVGSLQPDGVVVLCCCSNNLRISPWGNSFQLAQDT